MQKQNNRELSFISSHYHDNSDNSDFLMFENSSKFSSFQKIMNATRNLLLFFSPLSKAYQRTKHNFKQTIKIVEI
jgi:hypothetical protein